MTYKEARVYLDEVSKYGSVLGLDAIRNLLAELDDPQEDLSFIHIAGTNGKGSVLAYTSTILSEAGYKVGRYISPSVMSYLERIQIDGEWISEDAFAELTENVKEAAARLEEKGKGSPTVFEIETAVAFLYFQKEQCDLVVLETGLGGAQDATNIVENTKVAVFTSISRDHMKILGDTLEKITEQKAGIIKEGCCVVTARQNTMVQNILMEHAKKLVCQMYIVIPGKIRTANMDVWGQDFSYGEMKMVHLGLSGSFQAENAAVACEVIYALRDQGYVISEEALEKGLAHTRWPGRFTCISREPLVIVDGAHNEEAALQLRETISQCLPGKRQIHIMGVFRDKEYEKIAAIVATMADKVYAVDLPDPDRTLPAEELAATLRQYCGKVEKCSGIDDAVKKALSEAGKEDVVLAYGSLSYLGRVMEIVAGEKIFQIERTEKEMPIEKPEEKALKIDHEKIKRAVRLLLEGIGEDVDREGLVETPDRIARMCEELYGGMRQDASVHLEKTFQTDYDEMVLEKDITFYSTCEHHMLPFYGKVHIAYLPNGRVAGLSKLARTVEVYARRLQLQEQLTGQIADALMQYLKPRGVMVMIEAEHMCMTMRGIQKPGSRTVTVAKRGVFQEDGQFSELVFRMLG